MIAAFRDAPTDDEPWTEDDETAAAEGRADIAAGRTVSLAQAITELDECDARGELTPPRVAPIAATLRRNAEFEITS